METNVRYTIVGAFVIVLCAAIILGIIWLSSGFALYKFDYYRVYMQEAVTGLSVDSLVEYNGVEVGTVTSIHIDHKNPNLVALLLRIKKSAPITRGTRAKLYVRALSGVATINLEDKGDDMRPLEAESDQPYPVIATSPSFFLRLDAVITQMSTSFREISASIHSLLDEENLKNIKQTLDNLRILSGGLVTDAGYLHTIIQSASKSAVILQTQTLPGANQAILNFNKMTNDLSSVSTEIKQNPAILIRGREPKPLGPGEK